ncbi:MAG TPA: hypothetical protein VMV86_01145, partial [Methanosarcinales archaeon]|nr:hypothetical protein [Methanosarcinales archaeon]
VPLKSNTPSVTPTPKQSIKPIPKMTPAQKKVYAEELGLSPKEPLVIPKTPSKQLVVGKGVKKNVVPQGKIISSGLNKVNNPIISGLGKGAMATLNAVNSALQSPATIAVRGGEGVKIAQDSGKNPLLGAIKGIGTGLKDVLTGQNTVENAQLIETVAPKTTAELKAKYPQVYNVMSTLADFVGVDDMFAIGLAGDIAKVMKLNNMPASTADLNRLFSKIKTNVPLTVVEQAIIKENPDIVNAIRKPTANKYSTMTKQVSQNKPDAYLDDYLDSIGDYEKEWLHPTKTTEMQPIENVVNKVSTVRGPKIETSKVSKQDFYKDQSIGKRELDYKLDQEKKGNGTTFSYSTFKVDDVEYHAIERQRQGWQGGKEYEVVDQLGNQVTGFYNKIKNQNTSIPTNVKSKKELVDKFKIISSNSDNIIRDAHFAEMNDIPSQPQLPKREFTPSTTTQKGLQQVQKQLPTPLLKYEGKNLPSITQPQTLRIKKPIEAPKPLSNINTQPITNSGLKPNVATPKVGKERGFVQNVKGDITTPQSAIDKLNKDKILYEPISNIGTLNKVAKKVESNPTEALTNLLTGTGKGLNADDVATGELLIKKAFESGDDTQAYSIISSLAEKLTEAGQAVQAASMFKRMTPEGMLMYAEKTIAKANRDMEKVIDPFKKFYKKGQLTDEIRNSIKVDMENAMKLPEGREKSVKMAQIMQTIGEAMPTSPGAKFESARTMAMLSNPKTWIRNILGNAAFGGVESAVTKPLSTLIDKGLKAKTGQRTLANTNFKKIGEGLKEGSKNALSDFKLGIDTSPTRGMLELPRSNTFKNIPILDQLERTVKLGVSGGDRPFYDAAFKDAISEQLRLHKINTGEALETATDAMKQAAEEIARYRTYADNNMISESLSKVKRGLNTFRVAGIGAGDILMKFTKTPANLLARGIDYSPAGLIKGMVDVGKVLAGNDGLQRKAAEGLSRGIIGTGFVAGAITLTNLGIMRGKRAKSTTANAFEQATGRGQYTINTSALSRFVSSGFNAETAKPQSNDTIQTYDWAQPLALSAGTGANISEDLKRKQKVDAINLIGTVIESLESGVNTIVEQPMLQNISRVFKGSNPVEGLMSVVQSYPASFVPAFLQGMRYATDPTLRDISGNFLEGVGKLIINKIPGASKTLAESIDVLGKPRKVTATTPMGRLLDGALNPARTTKIQDDKTTEAIMSLYNVTNDGNILPNLVERSQTIPSIKKGEPPKELTVEQRNQYQKLLAEEYMSRAQIIISNPGWKITTQEKKLELLTSARNKADNVAKKKMQNIVFGR